ncbi:MAG: amidohydrolase family protein [Clostridiales bacterium]|nr:amidohydrolase family protein [Clostridiales bacterium]
MKFIGVEEHFSTPDYVAEFKTKNDDEAAIFDKICDVGPLRVAQIDEAGVAMQIVSLSSPGIEQLGKNDAVRVSAKVNEYVAQAIEKNPERFRAFMAIPTISPQDAIGTLRETKKTPFVGVCINGRIGDKYLDNPEFLPMLKAIEALDLPVYLHPCRPPKAVVDNYYAGPWPDAVADKFSRGALGWHIETTVHVFRMILGGVFDQCPDLKIVIGHLGEGAPFFFQRFRHVMPQEATKLKHPVDEYLKKNIYYTIGGFNYNAVFNCLAEQVGVDHILFSSDYPFGSLKAAVDFLNQLPLNESDKHKIAHENAERLFHL